MASEVNIINFSDICRACLIKTESMKSILDNNDETLILISKLASVSNLEIEINDRLPSYLCNSCESRISLAYDFQQLCRRSYDFISECLAKFNADLEAISADKEESIEPNIKQDFQKQSLNLNDIKNELSFEHELQDSDNDSEQETEAININGVEYTQCTQEEVQEVISKIREKFYRHVVCNFCKFQAVDNRALSVHMSRLHRDVRKSWCSSCNEVFENIQAHNEAEHSDDFRCPFCKTLKSNMGHFMEHLAIHASRRKARTSKNVLFEEENEDSDEDYQPIEYKKGKLRRNLRIKLYAVEDVEKAISKVREKFYKHVVCSYCKFEAINNRSLSSHMTRVHSELKGAWCSSCNKVFHDLGQHFKNVHAEDLRCPFCKKIKAKMGHFMEHLAYHSAERLHKCNICHQPFTSLGKLNKHKKIHLADHPVGCDLCHKRFMSKKTLKLHLRLHVQCKICELMFISQEEFKIHSCFGKSGEDENLIQQEVKHIKNEYEIKDITDEKVPTEPQNYCKDCNKKVRSLPDHIKKCHDPQDNNKKSNKELKMLCPHCGKQFRTCSKLNVHLRIHTGENPYKCQYCDKRVKTRNILIVHERTHTGEKPYICKVCGKGFAQSSVRNTHMRLHTGRPEQCNICNKRFCRPAELRLHMRKHTGEKPFHCNHCGQSFGQKSHLVEHVKTHTDERPYKCEYCEKAFKHIGTLKGHIQIHTGQKPYKCSQCSYACRQPYSLTQHMLQHDNDKPQPERPHICNVCHRSYQTVAHFAAHYNRYHGTLDINDISKAEVNAPDDIGIVEAQSEVAEELDTLVQFTTL